MRTTRLVIIGLAGLYVLVSLSWPLGWDQGILAWVGSVVASGGLPFRDAWDPKGPGSYLPFALTSAVAGPLPVAYRVMELLLLLGGCFAVASAVRALGLPTAASFAAPSLVLTQPSLGYKGTLQPDQWAGWLLAGSVAIALGAPRHSSRWAAAGGLVGLAAAIKPHYALMVLPLWWTASAPRTVDPRKEEHAHTWWLLAGAVLPLVACLLWFAAGGGLQHLLDGLVTANMEARLDSEGGTISFQTGVKNTARSLPFLFPLSIAAAVGLLWSWRRSPRQAGLVFAWLVATLVGVGLQGRWFLSHWTPLLPPLIVLGIAGFASLLTASGDPDRMAVQRLGIVGGGLLAVVAVVLASRPLARESLVALARVTGRIDRQEYLDRYRAVALNFSAAEIENAASHLSRATSPKDCVLVWPEPGVNVLADRRTPSRFASVAALTRYTSSSRRLRYRSEFLTALEQRPPRLILIDTMATSPRLHYVGDLVTRFPAFLRFLRERYDSIGPLGKYQMWAPLAPVEAACDGQ